LHVYEQKVSGKRNRVNIFRFEIHGTSRDVFEMRLRYEARDRRQESDSMLDSSL